MSKINKIQVDGITYDIEDANVPSWAREETKPDYNYDEINNAPTIPTKTSELENDSHFLDKNANYNLISGRAHFYNAHESGNGSTRIDIAAGNIQGAESGGGAGTLHLNKNSTEDVRILENGTGTLYCKGNEVADKEYVDKQIENIEIPDSHTHDNKAILDSISQEDIDNWNNGTGGNVDLSNKTNTSVLPNDNGDIKTRFRICNKAEDESPVIYFPLVKLPVDNSKNSASVILRGRLGGFLSKDMAMVNALIWNRTTTGISLLNVNADTYTLEEPLRLCDIVVYTNEDTSDTVYLKCREWFVFDIDLEVYQSTAEIIYDGTYLTEEPTGTLSASASTSDKRVEVYNGKLYLNGTEINGDIDLSDYASKDYVDEKVASIEASGGVDLSGYIKNTDYASEENVGVVKTENYYGLHTSSRTGTLYCSSFTYGEYMNEKDDNCFVSKGTLENVIEGKGLTSGGSSLDVYSTEEKVVGTYDGETVYRKIIRGKLDQTYANAYWCNTQIGNVKRIVNYNGTIFDSADDSGNGFNLNYATRATLLTTGYIRIDMHESTFANKYFDGWVDYTKRS